jgi:hypothetical protein
VVLKENAKNHPINKPFAGHFTSSQIGVYPTINPNKDISEG